MGSPDFALPSLKSIANNFELVGVVTQPDRRSGRGRTLSPPPVKIMAQEFGIPVFQPETLRTPDSFAKLQSWSPDLIVVAAFGQILKPNILELPEYGCVNVHASLLPRWRGAAPINAAILHGDSETGITIMKMDAGLDTGPVLGMRSVEIKPDETAGALSNRLANLGGELLTEILPKYLVGDIQPVPQTQSGETYAPMLSKKDGAMDFSRSADYLARMVRAYQPWPGTFTTWKEQPLKIHQAYAATASIGKHPGTRTIRHGLPAIVCGEGILVFEVLQPAGKKPMPGDVFLNGARDWQLEE